MLVAGGTKLLNPKTILEQLKITQAMKVGDLGCGGMGHFAFPCLEMVGKKGLVYAVDVQKNVLRAMESQRRVGGFANLKLVWSDLEVVGRTNIPEATLDCAIIVNVLFQNKKKRNILEEAARLLKTGGKLLVVDWKSTSTPFGPPSQVRVNPEEIEKLAAETGLRIIKHFDAGSYHFGLIFEKT